MTSIKNSQGFTLVEVMVAMVLVSIVALSTMYALKVSSRREIDSQPLAKVFMSYKNIKGKFHGLVLTGESLQPAYQCVLRGSPVGAHEMFERSMCDEQLFLDTTNNYLIQVSQTNDPSSCIYQVQLAITNKTSGSLISRRWSDQC
jgi:prepilin-type N-terminal cleavage/methylation domain-containing protein